MYPAADNVSSLPVFFITTTYNKPSNSMDTDRPDTECTLLKITFPFLFTTTIYNEPSSYTDTDLTQNVPQELCSNSYLNTEKTRAILPMARILFRMTSFRRLAAVPVSNHRILKFKYTSINRFKVHVQFYTEIFSIKFNTSCLQKTMYKLYNKMTLQLQLLRHNCINQPEYRNSTLMY